MKPVPVFLAALFLCLPSANAEVRRFLHCASPDGAQVQGKAVQRVFANSPDTWKKVPRRTHGAGLTLDDSQLRISDQGGQRIYTFHATVSPPQQIGHLDLSIGGHCWVCFSLDGKYGYNPIPDVFDVASEEKIATLTDENGKHFASSEFIEVHFEGEIVVKVSCEFRLERKP